MKIINKDFEELKEPKYEIVFDELHNIIIKYFESIGINEQLIDYINKKKNDLLIQLVDYKLGFTNFKENDKIYKVEIPSSFKGASGIIIQNFDSVKYENHSGLILNDNYNILGDYHTLLHEYFHYLSKPLEYKFTEDKKIYAKAGLKFTIFNDKEEMIDNSYSNGFLDEGMTEYMASKLLNCYPDSYDINVMVIELLNLNNHNELIDAYFSEDARAMYEFKNLFETITGYEFELLFKNNINGVSIPTKRMTEIIKSTIAFQVYQANALNIEYVINSIQETLKKYDNNLDMEYDREDIKSYIYEIYEERKSMLNKIEIKR